MMTVYSLPIMTELRILFFLGWGGVNIHTIYMHTALKVWDQSVKINCHFNGAPITLLCELYKTLIGSSPWLQHTEIVTSNMQWKQTLGSVKIIWLQEGMLYTDRLLKHNSWVCEICLSADLWTLWLVKCQCDIPLFHRSLPPTTPWK